MAFVTGPVGRRASTAGLVLAWVFLALAVVLLIHPGWTLHAGPIRLAIHRPGNPALFSALLFVLYAIANGVRATGRAAWLRFTRGYSWFAGLDERVLAGLIALGVFAVGLAYATTVAGGADSYGYLSQADLWLAGNLHVDQPWVRFVPWPNAAWTFSPLGYHPARHSLIGTLVPVYSPGLPMLMAVAKRLAGQAAMFWIMPLSGVVFVLSTYGIGRRLGSPKAGLAAAWLVATSPAALFMLMAPMTDVPVAACWALSFYALLGDRAADALIAGVAAGVALLIRPNLVLGVPCAGLWYLIAIARATPADRARKFRDGVLFSCGPIAAAACVAELNARMYGSPLTSGYGSTESFFAIAHVSTNVHNYFSWFVDSQTVVALAGIVALFLPVRRLWPAAKDRLIFVPIALFVLTLWGLYLAYLQFDVWWYLRFLLASWPFIMAGVGAVAVALVRNRGPLLGTAVTIGLILLGIRGIAYARDAHAFSLWHEDRRYVIAGQLAREMTPDASVIYSMQHSGSLRYYAGRVTLRYDLIDPAWVDRSIEYFTAHGIHPYLVAEDWEMPDIRRRFYGTAAAERLNEAPIFVFRGSNTVRMYDLSPGRDESRADVRIVDDPRRGHRDVAPAPLSVLRLGD